MGIVSLQGLEHAKNLKYIELSNNKIQDLSPLSNLTKLEYANLSRNKITDITCIKDLDKLTIIQLEDNYIDFSNGSNNLKILENLFGKDEIYNNSTIMNTIVCSQRYGNPEDEQKNVTLDSKIKNKLISYGLDKNKDGQLSRLELYEANYIEGIYKIDLSNLGLTNINGLEYLCIYEINLSNNNLTDISIFRKNRKINVVNLSHNKIKDISPFENYNNLLSEKVDLSYNEIEDISTIKTWPIICKDSRGGFGWGEPNFRNIEIDLSNNKISNIEDAKEFRHIKKLNLSNNKISNIEPLASYDFVCWDNGDGTKEELLEGFEGIILTGNIIDKSTESNKKAIDVFKKKNVQLQIGKQSMDILKDIKKSDWYYNSVKYVYDRNIIVGATETLFRPNNKLSRGNLVTILWRMEGSPIVNATNKFTDIKASDYYYEAVKWAASKKIVNGYSETKFAPNNNITREQLAVMLNNYAKYKNKNVNKTVDLSKFEDSKRVSSYAIPAVQWAIASKIISGKQEGKKIDPQGSASRAEAAAMIQNYCNYIK